MIEVRNDSKRKHILFVTLNHEHKADMLSSNVRGFVECADIDFYGPGYCTQEELSQGLKKYYEENGFYDFILLDFALAMLMTDYMNIREVYKWNRYFLTNYNVHDTYRYADIIINDLFKIDCIKILFYHFDTYTFPEQWDRCIQYLLDNDFYFCGFGKEFFPRFTETDATKRMGASWRYYDFCERNQEKIISYCIASINSTDMFASPLVDRDYDITVPGNIDEIYYPHRTSILRKLESSSYKMYDDYSDRTFGYLESKETIESAIYKSEMQKEIRNKLKEPCVYINSQLSHGTVVLWRDKYNMGLRKSKMAYACGGVSLQLVRKFVEIPARGTLLLCHNIPPLKDYGFIDGENMVVVNETNLFEKCDYLLSHPKEMQKIAKNGQKMVFEKHTAVKHAQLVLDAVEVIKTGKFAGSKWEDGKYVINTR